MAKVQDQQPALRKVTGISPSSGWVGDEIGFDVRLEGFGDPRLEFLLDGKAGGVLVKSRAPRAGKLACMIKPRSTGKYQVRIYEAADPGIGVTFDGGDFEVLA